MKHIIILIAALATSVTFAQAQGGVGYVESGYNYSTGTSYSGGVVTHSRGGNYGYNQGHVRGRRNVVVRRNVVRGNAACAPAPRQRVRFIWSDCGTFQWRLVESPRWIAPRVVYRNGCRRRVAGYYDWRCTSRTRVYASRGRRGW
ncbi:MAG: hypothetical protein AAF998_09215 [Bacteroidota bacterium]